MGVQKEKSGGKLYYTMGEVAEMLDVNQSLIRFWEQKFDVVKPKKNRKGNRMFTPADVRNLKMIYHLVKERGMTLAGAQKYIKANRGDMERDMEITERLLSIRALLMEVRQQLGADGPVIEEAFDDPREIHEDETAGIPASEPLPESGDAACPEEEPEDLSAAGSPHTDSPETDDTESAAEEKTGEKRERPVYIEQTLF